MERPSGENAGSSIHRSGRPIASMPEDDLEKLVAPTIQNWLDPTKPLQKPKGGSAGTKPTKTTEPKPRTDR